MKASAKSDSFCNYLGKCTNLSNLLIFVFLFCAASFNYYLLNFFLKYMKGDVFTNSAVSSLAETIAHIIAGFIVLKIGAIRGLCFANSLAAASAALLWIANVYDYTSLVPVSILAGKFGTGAAFCMLYMSTL